MVDPRRSRPLRELTEKEEEAIQAGITQDPDNPELSDAQLAGLRPASEVLPTELFARLVRDRVERSGPPEKVQVRLTLSLDAIAVEAWRASGPDWQARIEDLLTRQAPSEKRRA